MFSSKWIDFSFSAPQKMKQSRAHSPYEPSTATSGASDYSGGGQRERRKKENQTPEHTQGIQRG